MGPITWVMLAVGLGILVLGSDWLVKGAAHLARRIGISPLVIGLTVVAMGTSAPELAVTLKASLAGQTDLAVGNVVGSNIFNVLFILGLSALVAPLVVSRQLIRFDVPLMILASMLVWAMASNGVISRIEGGALVACIVAYTVHLVRQSRRQHAAPDEEVTALTASVTPGAKGVLIDAAYGIGGLALLVVGSRLFVSAAVSIAQALGVSEFVIGVTIVAAGTSLPEVATSVMAALRGHRDIAVGNVVGSNLFNLLAVLGVGAALSPHGVGVAPAALAFDFPIMIGAAFLCLPFFLTRLEISRAEGGLLLAGYLLYTLILVLKGGGNPLSDESMALALYGFLPAVAAFIVMTLYRDRTACLAVLRRAG